MINKNNYFKESPINFIKLDDNIFDIRVLRDQFKFGNFINMYSGMKFEKDFINNILDKEVVIKKVMILPLCRMEVIERSFQLMPGRKFFLWIFILMP